MLITFMQNQVIMCDDSGTTEITTDPMPVGSPSLNASRLTLNVHYIFARGTSPVYSLIVDIEGSNDGQTWHATDVSITQANDQNNKDSAAFDYAFARAKVSFSLSQGDWAAGTIDVHGNFVSA